MCATLPAENKEKSMRTDQGTVANRDGARSEVRHHLLLKIFDNLIYIFVRDISYLFLVINCNQVNACVGCFNDYVKGNYSKPATFASSFALDAKTDLSFSSSERNSYFRVLHQFILKIVDVIGKGMIALGQAFGLTNEFFSIVKGYHSRYASARSSSTKASRDLRFSPANCPC